MDKVQARLGWSGGASRRPADRALSLLSLVVTDTKSKAARPVPRFKPGARRTNTEAKPEAKPQKVKRAGFGGARRRTAPGASCLEWNRRTWTPRHHPRTGAAVEWKARGEGPRRARAPRRVGPSGASHGGAPGRSFVARTIGRMRNGLPRETSHTMMRLSQVRSRSFRCK